ncbi:hypothetical protein CYY_002644 [Polysphondylium violaceum]|uniref:Uncharacterized protein n=1 Tax=Polysphondylium violaceum TaxID=133409 RepID=A0A8J4PYG3_9MYCE|nr:hypothetical protein CYY_002644 [Polysphondylium violaceum]
MHSDQSRVNELLQEIFEKRKLNVVAKKQIQEIIPTLEKQNQIEGKITYLKSKRLQLEKLREKINSLKGDIDKDNKFIDAKKKYLSSRRSNLKKSKVSFENVNSNTDFLSIESDIQSKKQLVNEKNMTLESLKKQRIEKIVNNTMKIQISQSNPDHFIIVNIVINDKTLLKFPKDIVFTSLGYLVKILNLVTGVLGITLPYQMIYKGSKSLIQNDEKIKEYPLFYQHKTKSRDFQKALFLLGENIIFLRLYHGLSTPKEMSTYFIKNLYELFKSPNLGKVQKISEISSSMSTDIYDDTKEDEWEVVASIEDSDEAYENFVN